MYCEESIKNYLSKLASKEPIPGGGSASALVGSTGVACLEKVASFTIGNEKYMEFEAEIKKVAGRLGELRLDLNTQVSKDSVCYIKVAKALKMPKGAERDKNLEEALKEAVEPPLEICKAAHEAINLSKVLAEKGNKNLITDVGDGALFLEAAFKGAMLNVKINLKYIKDAAFADKTRKTTEHMETDVVKISEEIAKKIEGSVK